jgi:hypothetical protein
MSEWEVKQGKRMRSLQPEWEDDDPHEMLLAREARMGKGKRGRKDKVRYSAEWHKGKGANGKGKGGGGDYDSSDDGDDYDTRSHESSSIPDLRMRQKGGKKGGKNNNSGNGGGGGAGVRRSVAGGAGGEQGEGALGRVKAVIRSFKPANLTDLGQALDPLALLLLWLFCIGTGGRGKTGEGGSRSAALL